jgi:hypothetical protein
MNAAMDHPETVIPGLLGIVEEVLAEPGRFAQDADYIGHIRALLLLAQFREAKAFPLVQSFLHLPEDTQEELIGDLVSEGMPSLLASTCGGDTETLVALASDSALDPMARAAAMDALLVLGFQGAVAWDRMMGCFEALLRVFEFRGKEEDAAAWAFLACCVADGHLLPLVPPLEDSFHREWIDADIITPGSLEESLRLNAGHLRRRFLRSHHLVEDAILDFQRLEAFFVPGPDPDEDDFFDEEDEDFEVPKVTPEAIATVLAKQGQRAAPAGSPSRNSPCPCGSGKKFKRCCGK